MKVQKNSPQAGRGSVAEIPEGEVLLHSIEAARALLGNVGRTWLYEQIKLRRIRVVKLGTRTMIPNSELLRLVAECSAANDDGELQA